MGEIYSNTHIHASSCVCAISGAHCVQCEHKICHIMNTTATHKHDDDYDYAQLFVYISTRFKQTEQLHKSSILVEHILFSAQHHNSWCVNALMLLNAKKNSKEPWVHFKWISIHRVLRRVMILSLQMWIAWKYSTAQPTRIYECNQQIELSNGTQCKLKTSC